MFNSGYGKPLLILEMLRWSSPVAMLLVHERQWYIPTDGPPAFVLVFAHLFCVWILVVLLRQRCYRRFGPATHRVEPVEVQIGRVRIATATR